MGKDGYLQIGVTVPEDIWKELFGNDQAPPYRAEFAAKEWPDSKYRDVFGKATELIGLGDDFYTTGCLESTDNCISNRFRDTGVRPTTKVVMEINTGLPSAGYSLAKMQR